MTSINLKKPRNTIYALKGMEIQPDVLRAVIFDCDGVLLDSEPLHFASFKKTLEDEGDVLTEDIYKEHYLALDDKGAITKFFQQAKKPLSIEQLEALKAKKTKIYQDMVQSEGLMAYPAVPEFVMALSQKYPLGVASGSRRHELELGLEAAGLRSYFEVMVSADDVQKGKPDPESFLKTVEKFNDTGKRPTAIRPEECLVIEDSKEGISAAHTAKMKCIAVSTSYPAFELSHADLVIPSLAALKLSQLEDLYLPPVPKPAPSPQNN